MAYLAVRGSAATFGVSRLHEGVSRHIFQPLFPHWPRCEVPIGHITNAVHVPSWDSAEADRIWTAACGKERWRGLPDELGKSIEALSDEQIWAMRAASRRELVRSARGRLETQLKSRGHKPEIVAMAASALDHDVLTLGFARRFAGYKRPDLLLRDPVRFGRILCNERRRVQIVVAGKAHPDDVEGKRMIQEWIAFAAQPEFRRRVVFLEDYDIALAEELVRGVDVWINTPRRPWEACGTSGMKILANGGINLSELDGWWAEAYAPEVGWAIGDESGTVTETQDALDADTLYATLEGQVAPEFYDCDANGIPTAWINRIRRSMAQLAPQYCSTRMIHEYIRKAYLPSAQAFRERVAHSGELAKDIARWEARVRRFWPKQHIGAPVIEQLDASLVFTVRVYLGELTPADIRVELYADPLQDGAPEIMELARGAPIAGAVNGYFYSGRISSTRAPGDFTVRIVPYHAKTRIPSELPLILWQR